MLRPAVALFAIAFAAPFAGQKPAPRPAVALQGTWVMTSMNERPTAEGSAELSLTFSGANYHQTYAGKVNERGTFKVDTSKKPMTIDLTIVEGGDAGKTQLGIFELSGDTLRMHFDAAGGTARPTDMKAKEGTLLVVMKKQAKTK
jgi:uncharacterized protein (TIGR03067 family)